MTCTHHWLLDGGGSRSVPARCKLCGTSRTFNATTDLDDGWTGTTSAYVRADPRRTQASRARGAAAQRKKEVKHDQS